MRENDLKLAVQRTDPAESDTATYMSDCTHVGTDTIGVGIFDKNKRSRSSTGR